ncbi:hypothetical protein GCM10010467_30160 [Actinocorallia glomerata]|uniref:Transposase n=2 Tax=Actinomycetota TaxID=201174 RepID=A0ABP6PX73_9ACTN
MEPAGPNSRVVRYGDDVFEAVISMVSERISIRKAAAACGVSLSTVDRWVSQSQAGKPHGANGGGVSDGMCEPYREER